MSLILLIISARPDRDAADDRGVHLHGDRLQLLQKVLRLRGGGGRRPKVPRHAHGDLTFKNEIINRINI